MEQELFTLLEQLGSILNLSWVRVAQSLVSCVELRGLDCHFVRFLLTIVLSVLYLRSLISPLLS